METLADSFEVMKEEEEVGAEERRPPGASARVVVKEYVCAVLTDRFGAISVNAFDDIAKGKRSYQFASPVYASILYIRQKEAEEEGGIQTGEWHWIPSLKYGPASSVKGIESVAKRLLMGVASGILHNGDISRGHIPSSSPSSTYRFMTMPMRLTGSAAKAIARQKIHGPKRKTWNASYEAAVTMLRSAAQNVPRNVKVMRFFTDGVSVPGAFLPAGCLRATEKILYQQDTPVLPSDEECMHQEESDDKTMVNDQDRIQIQEIEWIWPRKELTPDIRPAPLGTAYEVREGFISQHLANILRNKARLVVLYLHGGAFALCGRGTHRELAFRFALACGQDAVVCLPEYRRPPEASVSHALRDARRAYDRILSYGVPASRIILAGDSAGGGLVLALLSELKIQPAAAILLSPWVDLDEPDRPDEPLASRNCNQRFDFLPRDLIDFFTEITKIQKEDEVTNFKRHYATPEEMKHFPPLLINVGQCEVLYDQVVALPIPKEAHLVVWRDMVHVSPCFAAFHDNPRQQLRMCGNFARAMVPPPPFSQVSMSSTQCVQIDIVAATIAVKGSTSMLGIFSSTYLSARLKETENTWLSTEACRDYKPFEDDKDVINFDFGANGNCATVILPIEAASDVSQLEILIEIRCNSALSGTRLLATATIAPKNLSLKDVVPVGPLYLDDDAGVLQVAINLVSDHSFLAPPGTIVDHLRVQQSTRELTVVPAHDAPPNENPQRFLFERRPETNETSEETLPLPAGATMNTTIFDNDDDQTTC